MRPAWNNFTTGQIYDSVIRKGNDAGEYLGKTVSR